MVTGTSGRVGGAVAASLTADGERVVGIDRRPGASTTIVGDLASMDLGSTLARCHTVIHCAALHAPHLTDHSRAEFVAANVTATRRLCDAATAAGVRRSVFLSTTSVYGHALANHNSATWVTEDLAPEPRDVYDETKLDAEQLVEAAHGPRTTTITLRLARCFPESPRDTVVNRLYRGLDIRDAVHGIAATSRGALDRHHVLNLAGPRVFERSDLEELASNAGHVVDRRVTSLRNDFADRGWRLPSSIDRVYVCDAAQSILRYRPTHGVQSALDGGGVAPSARTMPTAC